MDQITTSIESHTKIHHFFPSESLQICAIIDAMKSNKINEDINHSNQLLLPFESNELQNSVLLRLQTIYRELERLINEEYKTLDGVKRFIEFIGSRKLNEVRYNNFSFKLFRSFIISTNFCTH